MRWLLPVGFAMLALAVLLGISGERTTPGVVNVYSARHYDTDDALYARFTELTGIRVNIIEGKSDELLARLRHEGALSPADLFIAVDAGRLHRAERRGLFQSVKSSVLDERVPASLRHPEGLWFGLTKRARIIVASVDRLPDTTSLDYADLATPGWKGRVLVRSSSNIYNQSMVSAMIATLGPERTEAWCNGIARNLARRPQGGDTDQIRAVAAGEGDVALVNHYYYARLLAGSEADRAVAERVRVIFPDQAGRGTHVNISGAGVMRHAPNRDNAVALLEFLAGDEAQRTLAAGNQEYPVVEGVATTGLLARLGTFKAETVDAVQLGANNPQAVRIMDRAGWR